MPFGDACQALGPWSKNHKRGPVTASLRIITVALPAGSVGHFRDQFFWVNGEVIMRPGSRPSGCEGLRGKGRQEPGLQLGLGTAACKSSCTGDPRQMPDSVLLSWSDLNKEGEGRRGRRQVLRG